MNYSHIKGVIFDMGSTLLEFENRPWPETTSDGLKLGYKLLKQNGHDIPDFEEFVSRLMTIMDELRVRSTTTLIERQSTDAPELYFSELGLNDPKELARWFMDEFYKAVTDQLTSCEGALETLREIKSRGYKTGMISNTPYARYQHEADLDKYGLTPYLEFRLYSSECGIRKPRREIFDAGLDMIGLPAEETIYVGDNYKWDVVGAQGAGMKPVLVYCEWRDYPDPMPEGFPVIHKLPELLDLLDN